MKRSRKEKSKATRNRSESELADRMLCEADAQMQNANCIYAIQLCLHIATPNENTHCSPYANRMVPASDSSWLSVLVRYVKQLSFSVSVSSFSSRFVCLALFLSFTTCKSSRFTQTPAGAVICLSKVFCCERKKRKEKHGAIVDCAKPGRRERILLLLFTLKWDQTVNWVPAFNRAQQEEKCRTRSNYRTENFSERIQHTGRNALITRPTLAHLPYQPFLPGPRIGLCYIVLNNIGSITTTPYVI